MLVALLAVAAASAADVDHVPGDFATIQEAVDDGTAPVIVVAPGQHEGARVTRPVRIEGQPGATIVGGPKVKGVGTGFALTGKASKTEITGFTFDCDQAGLDLGVYASAQQYRAAPDYVTISGNTFDQCAQGVTNAGHATDECTPDDVDGGEYWVVQDNTFRGFDTTADGYGAGGGIGIFLFNTKHASVLANQFTGAVEDTRSFTTGGVVVAGCWDCTIAQNTFAVRGGSAYWSAVSNFGYYQPGAAASQRLLLVDNDASKDAHPHYDVNYRSYDTFGAEVDGNSGVAFIDHTQCGDDRLETFERW
jgi:hypothetical protein